MDIPKFKTRKDTKSCLLGIIVVRVTGAKDKRLAKLIYFGDIFEGFTLYQRQNNLAYCQFLCKKIDQNPKLLKRYHGNR